MARCKFKGCTLEAYESKDGMCVLHKGMSNDKETKKEEVKKEETKKPVAKKKAKTSTSTKAKGIRARKKVIDSYEEDSDE